MPLVQPTSCSSLRLLLATKWFVLSDVSKSWKILLPLLVECFRMYFGETFSFLALANFPPPQYPLSLGHNIPNNFPLHPSPFFLLGANRLSAVPGLLATILHLQTPTNLVSMVLFCICPISTTRPPGNRSDHPS